MQRSQNWQLQQLVVRRCWKIQPLLKRSQLRLLLLLLLPPQQLQQQRQLGVRLLQQH